MLGRTRCPRCDERIRKGAVACRYCGHEFGRETAEWRTIPPPPAAWLGDETIASNAVETLDLGSPEHPDPSATTAESVGPSSATFMAPTAPVTDRLLLPSRRRPPIWEDMPWYRSWWLRAPALGFVVFSVGIAELTPRDWITKPIVTRVFAGLLQGVLLLGGVALVLWLIRRVVRRPKPYSRVLTSFPLMVVMLIGTLGSAGVAARHARDDPNGPGILSAQMTESEARALPPVPLPTTAAVIARRHAFSRWTYGYVRAQASRIRAVEATNRWLDAKGAALPLLAVARRDAQRYQTAAFAVATTPDTTAATLRIVQSAREQNACLDRLKRLVDEVQNVSEAQYKRRSARAYAHCARSHALAGRSASTADHLYNVLGGAAAFPGYIERIKAMYARSPGPQH